MNRYTVLSLVCLVLCVPLIVYLANRDSGRAASGVRFATFNLSLHRKAEGELLKELRSGNCEQGQQLAEIIQRTHVDVILLNELDFDDAAESAQVFASDYLGVSQNGYDPIDFPYLFAAPVNTGVPSGLDLDGDGKVEGPRDAFGYGAFAGQYGMVLLSRYPILEDQVRTFQRLAWSKMPGALRPDGYYSDEAWQHLRLSSKSHWDVPIGIGKRGDGMIVHALCSHPTPPVFDGDEDRNGCRNHDEVRFWVDYVGEGKADWIVDDKGVVGGLPADERFVVLGDLNCDPVDGDARRDALLALLAHERVQDALPRSPGATEAKLKQFGVNMQQQGDPAFDTGDFADAPGEGPGNLRVDYVLPSRNLGVVGSGVFWPLAYEPTARLAGASDHRLVWVAVRMP